MGLFRAEQFIALSSAEGCSVEPFEDWAIVLSGLTVELFGNRMLDTGIIRRATAAVKP